MNKFTALVSILSLLVATTAYAGGVVPQGLGMYEDGRTINTIPASSSMIRWRSYGSLTPLDRDVITYAVASVDLETQEFTLLWADAGEADEGQVEVFYSGKGDPLSPECLDSTPGGCTYANTTCLTKFRSGLYDLCTSYRVNLYMNNIANGAVRHGVSQPEFLKGIVRHETGHVLGLKHFDPGPMTNDNNAPFSQCQLDLWRVFNIDPTITTWSYPAEPVSCQ